MALIFVQNRLISTTLTSAQADVGHDTPSANQTQASKPREASVFGHYPGNELACHQSPVFPLSRTRSELRSLRSRDLGPLPK